MYQPATGDLEFGDVLSATWTFDVYVRGDAVPLKPFECAMGRNRPNVLGYQDAAPSPKRDLVLAHGRPHRAILLSDNCEVESVLVRRGSGRLIFAAVEDWPVNEDQADREIASQAFRRHPLPPGEGFLGGVVNLERLFAVGHDTVAGATPDPRVTRLDAEAVIDLEIRWNAYATRRGPRAHQDGATKLAHLLTANGDSIVLGALRAATDDAPEVDALDVAAANLVARVLTVGWALEGGAFNNVADAVEAGDHPDTTRNEIIGRLEELKELADDASRALSATRRPSV